jgi:hypothetical protein
VSAKFKGTINSGDEIFKIIDTDSVDVAPGEITKIRTYFNPLQEGQYMVTGRVLYNKKLTFEKSSVINVNPYGKPAGGAVGVGSVILLMVIIIIILLLIILIVKRGRKKQKRF